MGEIVTMNFVIPAKAGIRAPAKAHKQHGESPCRSKPRLRSGR